MNSKERTTRVAKILMANDFLPNSKDPMCFSLILKNDFTLTVDIFGIFQMADTNVFFTLRHGDVAQNHWFIKVRDLQERLPLLIDIIQSHYIGNR